MRSLLVLCAIYGVYGELVGPVTIMEDGQQVTRYVVSTYSPLANVSGSSIMLQHDSQVQIAKNSSSSYNPYMFMEYKLAVCILSLYISYLIPYNIYIIGLYNLGQNTFIYSRFKPNWLFMQCSIIFCNNASNWLKWTTSWWSKW